MGCDDKGMLRRGAGGSQARKLGVASVVVFDLCEMETFQATSAFGGNWDEYVLTGPEFASLGPAIEDIVIHAEGSNFTPDFTYDVQLQFRFKNGPWQFDSLLPVQNSGGYTPGTPFSDRSKLGMNIRIVLRTQIASGGSGTQHGDLTISAAVRLYCS